MKITLLKKMPLLFPILCSLFMILIAFTLFLSHEYSKQAVADVNMFTLSKMNHSYQNTQFTLDNIRSFGLSASQEGSINNWLIREQGDVLQDIDALKAITRFSTLQPFIHSMCIE